MSDCTDSGTPVLYVPPIWFYRRIVLRERGTVGNPWEWVVTAYILGTTAATTLVTLTNFASRQVADVTFEDIERDYEPAGRRVSMLWEHGRPRESSSGSNEA